MFQNHNNPGEFRQDGGRLTSTVKSSDRLLLLFITIRVVLKHRIKLEMTLDDYFKKSTNSMGKNKTKKNEGGDETQHTEQGASDDANASPGTATSDANTIIQALTAVIDNKLAGVTEKIEKVETSVIQMVDKKIPDVTQMIETRLTSALEAVAARGIEIQALSARVDIAEERIEAIDQTATTSEAKITTLEKLAKQLLERTEQLENYSRRCNVRILGIEEQKEGPMQSNISRSGFPSISSLTPRTGRLSWIAPSFFSTDEICWAEATSFDCQISLLLRQSPSNGCSASTPLVWTTTSTKDPFLQ